MGFYRKNNFIASLVEMALFHRVDYTFVGLLILYSRSMLLSGGNERQALKKFSIAAFCLNRAFTRGVPAGTKGALNKYDRIVRMLPNDSNSSLPSILNVTREQSSARRTRSRMMGLANKESSQVLWTTSVLCPLSIISDVYSSIALLLSPVNDIWVLMCCSIF